MKRPDYIIFTDKDGTLDLEDKNLNMIFVLSQKKNVMVIPITGRTVGDIMEEFKRKKIALPRLIVGDNGANVYDTKNQTFLIKKTLDHDKLLKIVDEFLKAGGKIENLRFTDGEKIFASNDEEVKNYYNNKKKVKICDDIMEEIRNNPEITKITLAGSEEEMKLVSKIVEEMGFWTDMDKTKFPSKKSNYYRLDIADKNINKGKIVRAIARKLSPKYGYSCIGNGANDVSMFKVALDDGMKAVIMKSASKELKDKVRTYSEVNKKGKVEIIEDNKNLANKYLDSCYKRIEQKRNEESRNNRAPNSIKETLKCETPIVKPKNSIKQKTDKNQKEISK